MMTITIDVKELFFDIRNKSHYEVSSISDTNQRYISEAGTEKTQEIYRCIIEAEARVRLMCSRFLTPATKNYGADNKLPSDIPESFTYTFKVNKRRQEHRGKAIADNLHEAIVNMALSRFYITVNQAGLAETHDKLAGRSISLLDRMLFEKLPPTAPIWDGWSIKQETTDETTDENTEENTETTT